MTSTTETRRTKAPFTLIVLLGAFLCASLAPATADAQVLVKMATLVPEGSSWHQVLKEVVDKWNKISGGRVQVRLYAGGVAGDDPDVVRKMRLGTLNAGVLTSVGVAEIDNSVYALSIPMAFNDYEEVYAVLEKMRPRLESSIEAKGFVVLNWADGGWVHFFAQKPVTTPDDLKKLKLFQWAGDPKTLEIWRTAGFNPVPLPSTELATALQTGLVEAFGAPPQVAVITRYYENAKNMTDLNWALLLGATVIKKDVWEKIDPPLRKKLKDIAVELGKKVDAEVKRLNTDAVSAMEKQGLKVVPTDPAPWRAAMEKVWPIVRGGVVPAPFFDEVKAAREACRKR